MCYSEIEMRFLVFMQCWFFQIVERWIIFAAKCQEHSVLRESITSANGQVMLAVQAFSSSSSCHQSPTYCVIWVIMGIREVLYEWTTFDLSLKGCFAYYEASGNREVRRDF